jgi:hypothetical protein
MDVQTDERLLRNIEGYLMQLVSRVESLSIDEVSLIAEVLASVQDALRTWHTRHDPLEPLPRPMLRRVKATPRPNDAPSSAA